MVYKFSYPKHVKKALDIISIIGKRLNVLIWVSDSRSPYLTSKYIPELLNKIDYDRKLIVFVNKMDLVNDFDYGLFRNYLKQILKRDFTVLYGSYKNCKELYNYLERLSNNELFLNCLFVGLPNVGKSSIINCLVNKKKTEVSVLPGTTRNLKWISLRYNIKILDSPGVVLPFQITQEELVELLELKIINRSFISAPNNKFL
ncbi:MAG: GTPase [Candidatus Calescibacterium sp.]|nr:50S ribosome-binding GTPase [Candidatus Calescibacterium sp.]MDW8132147.1 GTPase [Candidatus Calescibacterium sp.]